MVFLSVLLVVGVFISFSANDKPVEMTVEDKNDKYTVRPLTFATEEQEFEFSADCYMNILAMVEKADLLVAEHQKSADTTTTIRLGNIDKFKFDYKFYQYRKAHIIAISDTVENKFVYFLKYSTFVNSLNDL